MNVRSSSNAFCTNAIGRLPRMRASAERAVRVVESIPRRRERELLARLSGAVTAVTVVTAVPCVRCAPVTLKGERKRGGPNSRP